MWLQLWTFITSLFSRDAAAGVTALKEVIKTLEEVITQMDGRLQQCESRWTAMHELVAAADVNHVNAIVVADAGGQIIEWNEGAIKMFRYSRDEAVARNITMIIPPRFRRRHIEAFHAAVAEKKNWSPSRLKRWVSREMATKYRSQLSYRVGKALPTACA